METNAETTRDWMTIEKQIDSEHNSCRSNLKVESFVHANKDIIFIDDTIMDNVTMIRSSVEGWALFSMRQNLACQMWWQKDWLTAPGISPGRGDCHA
jgi:hypothetical protein